MRRAALVGAVLPATAASAFAAPPPALPLSVRAPMLLHGANFTPSSVVRLFVKSSNKTVLKAHTTKGGSFSVALPGAGADACKGLHVRALDGAGRSAAIDLEVPSCFGNDGATK